jgi:hypothetical protein
MARRGVCLARFTNIRPAGRTLFSGTDRADLDGFGPIASPSERASPHCPCCERLARFRHDAC